MFGYTSSMYACMLMYVFHLLQKKETNYSSLRVLNIPVHVTPLPTYPALQVHVKELHGVLLHVAAE